MQKKLFLILFGMIALISFPTTQTFGHDGQAVVHCIPLPPPNAGWSSQYYSLEAGDKIVAVNGQIIHDENDFYYAVKNSPTSIILAVIDCRTHTMFYLKTQLWPKYSQTRLGAFVNTSYYNDGVVVTGCMPNTPSKCCLFLESKIAPKFQNGSWLYND